MKYFFGIGIIALGFFMVVKSDWFVQNFGHSSWAEDHLGGGGTYLMYKLLGLAFIILALFGMTGLLGEIIIGVFGRLFGL